MRYWFLYNKQPARQPQADEDPGAQDGAEPHQHRSRHADGIDPAGLIPECSGHGGALQFMARAGDLRWRTLVF